MDKGRFLIETDLRTGRPIAEWRPPAASIAGWRVIILIAGLDVQILGEDGSPLRTLALDLTKDYQRQP